MSRGLGLSEFLTSALPDVVAFVLALLTQLGDGWFLGILLLALFLVVPVEEATVVLGLSLAGRALITILKHLFALPRPVGGVPAVETLPTVLQTVYAHTASASGYGFPSGHAMGTTIVFLLVVRPLDVGTPRLRYATAGAGVGVVSVTRVALGVHYLVDVVAGIIFGVLFLGVTLPLLDRSPADRVILALGLAFALGIVMLLVAGLVLDTVVVLGGSFAVLVGWLLHDGRVPTRTR